MSPRLPSPPSRRGCGARAHGATALLLVLGASSASAEVPTAPPTFQDPLDITNEYLPIQPEAVQVLRGKADGERFVVTHLHLAETRTFDWGGGQVETRVLKEVDFADGELVEVSRNYFAQADDGSVYYFGEVVDEYEDGELVSHDGSWLVGGKSHADDPDETLTATNPTLFMPANPEVGDQWKPEDLFPDIDETVTVLSLTSKQKVEAGKFQPVMKVRETSDIPGSEPETKWYAEGVGVIRTRGEGERIALISSTLKKPADG